VSYETDEHRRLRELGEAYEEFVVEHWPLVYFLGFNGIDELHRRIGREQQYQGETDEGVEIKFDQNIYEYFKKGRLYIETHEKADANNQEYASSGIYRNDNSVYYLIGNYNEWWIFNKEVLQKIDRTRQIIKPFWIFEPKPTGTSKGFCINVDMAHEYCEDYRSLVGVNR